jgi:hypothetical protein
MNQPFKNAKTRTGRGPCFNSAEREGNVLELQYVGYQIPDGLWVAESRIWRMAKNVDDFISMKVRRNGWIFGTS